MPDKKERICLLINMSVPKEQKHLFENNRHIIHVQRPGDRKGENVGHKNNYKVLLDLSRREWKVRTITIRNNDRSNREQLNWRYLEPCNALQG